MYECDQALENIMGYMKVDGGTLTLCPLLVTPTMKLEKTYKLVGQKIILTNKGLLILSLSGIYDLR
jgi:hypothetical protein